MDGRTSEALARRTQIVAAAAFLFEEQGYTKTSMNDIAAAASLTKPGLYHYFTSKEEILYHVHEAFLAELFSRHESRRGIALTPQEIVSGMINDIVDLMRTHRGFVRVFFENYREITGQSSAEVMQRRRDYFNLMADAIAAGVESGAFATPDPRLAARAIFGMANWTYHWYRPDGTYSAAEIASSFSTLALKALRP